MATEIAELNEQSTTEEVNTYVEQVLKDVEADRAGEKSDSQITAEHGGTEETSETPVETESDSKAAPDQGDDTGDASATQEWITDDVKAEAAAYNLEESDLADFGSREELDRAMRLFNKDALKAGRDVLDGVESEDGDPTRNEKGQFEKKGEPDADETPKGDGQYEPLDEKVWDDDIVGVTNNLNDRLAALEAHLQGQQQEAAVRSFDAAIDALNHPKLFGKETGSESKQQMLNRQAVHRAVMQQMQTLGADKADYDQWVKVFAIGMFADEFAKNTIKNQTRKVSKQSDGRQGSGNTRPSDPRESARDRAGRRAHELGG